jgi:hypothetical protein
MVISHHFFLATFFDTAFLAALLAIGLVFEADFFTAGAFLVLGADFLAGEAAGAGVTATTGATTAGLAVLTALGLFTFGLVVLTTLAAGLEADFLDYNKL